MRSATVDVNGLEAAAEPAKMRVVHEARIAKYIQYRYTPRAKDDAVNATV